MLLNYKLQSGKFTIIFWIIVFILSFMAMLYLGLSPELIENWYLYLVLFNTAMSLIAIYFIYINVKGIRKDSKKDIIGFRFAWTFIKIIICLLIFPLGYFYAFSFTFIGDNVSKAQEQFNKFNVTVGSEVDSLYEDTENSKFAYYLNKTTNITQVLEYVKLEALSTEQMETVLNQLILDNWACELAIYNSDMNIVATAKSASKICLQESYKASSNDYILLANYTIDSAIESLSSRMIKFRDAAKNANLETNVSIIQKRFIIDFSSTVALGVIIALLLVLRSIKQLVMPMQNLSLATREISKGNYNFEIKDYPKNTDLEDLIVSFNNMSKRIKNYREGLDTHNLYLETILKYSAGVISLNKDRTINIINPIVLKMLHIKGNQYFIGKNYKKIITKYKYLKPLILCIEKNIDKNIKEWREEIALILPDRNILIYCQGASLDIEDNNLGYVIVVNDISKLHRAQKKAAWGEVAVRMAHEIKNPLNPIMLSAQRLRDMFLDKLKNKDYEIVDKTTNTIIDQVKNMSSMVSSFADYSNIPGIERKPLFLNTIINKVVSLYDAQQEEVSIDLNLSGDLPKLYLDENAISRVFINIIKNAIEAINKSRKLNIFISTYFNSNDNIVVMTIVDDGNGFDKQFIDKIFEPYTTTKKKGSGLGLAIVQNIIDQHDSQVYASNVEPHGARITIEFSIIDDT